MRKLGVQAGATFDERLPHAALAERREHTPEIHFGLTDGDDVGHLRASGARGLNRIVDGEHNRARGRLCEERRLPSRSGTIG